MYFVEVIGIYLQGASVSRQNKVIQNMLSDKSVRQLE